MKQSAHVQHERAELKLGTWRVGSLDAEHHMVAWSASHDLQPAASPRPGRDLDREVGLKRGVFQRSDLLGEEFLLGQWNPACLNSVVVSGLEVRATFFSLVRQLCAKQSTHAVTLVRRAKEEKRSRGSIGPEQEAMTWWQSPSLSSAGALGGRWVCTG